MFKKENRLPVKTIKPEQVFRLEGFILKTARNNLGKSRFGFIVSKNIDKRASARNRAKRLFRRVFEENFKRINKGVDFLLIAKKMPQEETFIKLGKLLEEKSLLK